MPANDYDPLLPPLHEDCYLHDPSIEEELWEQYNEDNMNDGMNYMDQEVEGDA